MKKALPLIIGLAVVIAGGALLLKKPAPTNNSSGSSSSANQSANNQNQTAACPTPPANTVSYCDGAFNSLTVAAGTAVTFKNDGKVAIQVASDPHPTHTDNPELNVDIIEPGKSKTVTLKKTGTWGFHNHFQSSERGTITVN